MRPRRAALRQPRCLILGLLNWAAMGNAPVPLPERLPPWSGWPAFRAGADGGRRCTGSAWKSSQPG